MFAIDNLWKLKSLSPLRKAWEADNNDRRIVVVLKLGKTDEVDVVETEALHAWLESQSYRMIPPKWETEDGDELDVIHVRQLAVTIQRRNPFMGQDTPVLPNSWLNGLPQELFDAILLAQALGELEMDPGKAKILDDIKPKLTAKTLSTFWSEMVAKVQFAQSGQSPRNAEQQKVLSAWQRAQARRHFDPNVTASATSFTDAPAQASGQVTGADMKIFAQLRTPKSGEIRAFMAQHLSVDDLKVLANNLGELAAERFPGEGDRRFSFANLSDRSADVELIVINLRNAAEGRGWMRLLHELVYQARPLQYTLTFARRDEGNMVATNGGVVVHGSVKGNINTGYQKIG